MPPDQPFNPRQTCQVSGLTCGEKSAEMFAVWLYRYQWMPSAERARVDELALLIRNDLCAAKQYPEELRKDARRELSDLMWPPSPITEPTDAP